MICNHAFSKSGSHVILFGGSGRNKAIEKLKKTARPSRIG